jgi:hypothetical protein
MHGFGQGWASGYNLMTLLLPTPGQRTSVSGRQDSPRGDGAKPSVVGQHRVFCRRLSGAAIAAREIDNRRTVLFVGDGSFN